MSFVVDPPLELDETHNPWTLKLSNMISAVFSLFSGGFRGGSVYSTCQLRSLEQNTLIRKVDAQDRRSGLLALPSST